METVGQGRSRNYAGRRLWLGPRGYTKKGACEPIEPGNYEAMDACTRSGLERAGRREGKREAESGSALPVSVGDASDGQGWRERGISWNARLGNDDWHDATRHDG